MSPIHFLGMTHSLELNLGEQSLAAARAAFWPSSKEGLEPEKHGASES